MKEEYEIILLKTKKFDDDTDISLTMLYALLYGINKKYWNILKIIQDVTGNFSYNDAKESLEELLKILKKKVGKNLIYDENGFRWKNE